MSSVALPITSLDHRDELLHTKPCVYAYFLPSLSGRFHFTNAVLSFLPLNTMLDWNRLSHPLLRMHCVVIIPHYYTKIVIASLENESWSVSLHIHQPCGENHYLHCDGVLETVIRPFSIIHLPREHPLQRESDNVTWYANCERKACDHHCREMEENECMCQRCSLCLFASIFCLLCCLISWACGRINNLVRYARLQSAIPSHALKFRKVIISDK